MKPERRPELTAEQKEKMKAAREEHEKMREAYDAELQKIMTAEQYTQYKADMEKRRHGGPRGHRG
jgi:Spy/CpxP family protein refolding chaperone